jgi:hypothetical protein
VTVLIDGDIVAYRAAYSTEGGHADDVADKVDELMDYILDATTFDGSPFKVYLTGDGNFRYDVAVTVPYKGNRKDTKKPEFLPDARDYLVEDYGAVVSSGEEADDLIAIEATRLGPHTIIASVDKDFLQVPCVHYNTNKQTFTEQDELSATRFFYTQILTGDRADNIQGLHRVGPVKAAMILGESTDEVEMYNKCVQAYDGDVDRVIENARLLWLRREEGQLWHPPEAG